MIPPPPLLRPLSMMSRTTVRVVMSSKKGYCYTPNVSSVNLKTALMEKTPNGNDENVTLFWS